MNNTDAAARVDALLRHLDQPDAPGAAVLVARDGEPLCIRAFGLARLEPRVPCAPETNFRLASVTKPFTAMCILMLAEQGRLSLDDRLTALFPEFPAWGGSIRVRHLLNHTSGLPDYETLVPPGTAIPLADRDVLRLLMRENGTDFTPGSRFRYSNSGYALLALVVETVSGRTFPAFLKENIFAPLGMGGTLAYQAGISVVPHRAWGYAAGKDGGFNPADQTLTSAVLGDGGIYSSVPDLFKWAEALEAEQLAGGALWREALTPAKAAALPGGGYGFGWYVGGHRGTPRIWHYGSTCGFSTRLERFPGRHLTVIILANRRSAPIGTLPLRIADALW